MNITTSYTCPRNPDRPEALYMGDVRPGMSIKMCNPTDAGEVAASGAVVIEKIPVYGDDGWEPGAVRDTQGGILPLNAYTAGLVPSFDGTWPSAYVRPAE